jgi:hypothetical protein
MSTWTNPPEKPEKMTGNVQKKCEKNLNFGKISEKNLN